MKIINECDKLLSATFCERCGESLEQRTLSFFKKNEVIGPNCMKQENDLKQRIANKGADVNSFMNGSKVPNILEVY